MLIEEVLTEISIRSKNLKTHSTQSVALSGSLAKPGIVLKRPIMCYIFKDIKYDTERSQVDHMGTTCWGVGVGPLAPKIEQASPEMETRQNNQWLPTNPSKKF